MSLDKRIYDYARGKKRVQVVHSEEYKRGYKKLIAVETKGDPYACFIAAVDPETNKFYIGISACDIRHDTFSKESGRTLAECLMHDSESSDEEIKRYIQAMPRKLVSNLVDFYFRCIKYYKGAIPAYDYLEFAGLQHGYCEGSAEDTVPIPGNICEGKAICGCSGCEKEGV